MTDTSREAVEALIAELNDLLPNTLVKFDGGQTYDSKLTVALRNAASMLSSLLSERAELEAKLHDERLMTDEAYDRANAAEAEIASLRTKLEECERERDAAENARCAIEHDHAAAEAARAKAEEERNLVLKAVMYHFGPEGMVKVCDSVLAARTGANNG